MNVPNHTLVFDEYQLSVLSALRGQGRGSEARKLEVGWSRGVNYPIRPQAPPSEVAPLVVLLLCRALWN